MTIDRPTHHENSNALCDRIATGCHWVEMLAHELRSPLGSILFALEELQIIRASETDARAALDVARNGSEQMRRIIEDVLELGRSMHGKLPASRELIDLAEVAEAAVVEVRPQLVARRHSLTVSISDDLPAVHGQTSRMVQVLTNLLTNAAKFTEPGGRIALAVEMEENSVVVRIRDNGMGISIDLLPLIFDTYRQGPTPSHRSPQGLGIGLALVKSLVEVQGGTVTAHSDGPGMGAEFIVRLPSYCAFVH